MANKLYTLGRGELLFAPFLPGTQTPEGYDFLGNVPEFSLTREVTTLDHYDSTTGIKRKDMSVVTEEMMSGSFVADEIRGRNIAYFLGGTVTKQTVSSQTAVSSTFQSVIKGRRYQLGVSNNLPTGARLVSNVSVTNDATPTPATFVLGTDYTLDATNAMITVLESGSIPNGSNLVVTFNYAASTREIVTADSVEIEGALKFISRAPVGNKIDWDLPWVKLTPNGDLNLITDDWQTVPFSVEVLKREDRALAYAGGRAIAAV